MEGAQARGRTLRLKTWILAPVDREELHATDRAWLVIERLAFLFGGLASLIAIWGIVSWYLESEDRRIERAAKVYEASSGALNSLDQSRGRVDEIGQSAAVKLITQLHRPIETLDLNDVYLRQIQIPAIVVQKEGSLLALADTDFSRGRNSPVPAGSSCPYLNILSVDWLVARDMAFTKDTCIFGTFYADRIAANRISILNDPSPVELDEIRSKLILSALEERKTLQSIKRDESLYYFLPTKFDIKYSNIRQSSLQTYAHVAHISFSDLAGTSVRFHGTSLAVWNSSMRGGQLLTEYLISLNRLREQRIRCLEDAQTAYKRDKSTILNDLETSAAEMNKIIKELQCKSPRISIMGGGRSIVYFELYSEGVRIANSDIRGMDLSRVPPYYLDLENVCADETTKLPANVNLAKCGKVLSDFWDRLAKCDPHARKARSSQPAQCSHIYRVADASHRHNVENAGRRNKMFEIKVESPPDPLASFDEVALRFLSGQTHRVRAGADYRSIGNPTEGMGLYPPGSGASYKGGAWTTGFSL